MHETDGLDDVGLTTVAARQFLPPVGEPGGRAERVVARLREAISLGLILDGERLPSESELAAQLGVSTVTLREALAVLRDQGLVVTKRGRRGGTFVRAPADLSRHMFEQLGKYTTQQIRDLGDHRAAISGTAALLAAERASESEASDLARQAQRLRAARTASARRRGHTQFCVAVAAAAQSPRLAREELRLAAEIGDVLWLGMTRDDHLRSVRAREELADAIAAQDGGLARYLAEQHVREDTSRLLRTRIVLYSADCAVSSRPAEPATHAAAPSRTDTAAPSRTDTAAPSRADVPSPGGPARPASPGDAPCPG